MTARDYFREQNDEINGDSEAANGIRKKRKKGGKVKGLTARHRMDRHVRRQVGGGIPPMGAPATLGAAGMPGVGGGAMGGAGLPTGAAALPGAAPAGGIVPQMPAGAGAGIGRGIGAANPLGGAAGVPVGGAGLGAGLGGAGMGAGVRPPGMQRGGRARKMPADPIRQGKVLSEPEDNDYQAGGAVPWYGDPRGLTPRYAEEQHDALQERYSTPRHMGGIPPDTSYRDAPSPDELRRPPVRRGSEPPLPMQPQAAGGEVDRRRRRYAPGPRSEGPFGAVQPRHMSGLPSQLDYAEPPDPNGMAQEPPLRQGSMPPMARGGRLPEALEKQKYNGRKPPQKRQVGGGVRIPREPVGDRLPGVSTPQLGRGVGGTGLGTIGGGGISPTRAVPRSPSPTATRRMMAGVGPARFADGGNTSQERPRRQRGGRAPADMEDHSPRQTGGRAADYSVSPQRRQVGGRTEQNRWQGVGPVDPTQSRAQREAAREQDFERTAGTIRDLSDDLGIRSGYQSMPYTSIGSGRDDYQVGGRTGTREEDRWGQKWVPPWGVEETDRIDRSRGQYVRQGRIPSPGTGPDDNAADHTYPMADGGRLSAAQRRALPKGDFAVPGKNGYPVNDPSHARNALARVSQHGSPSEKAQVRAKVARKYPGISQSKSGGGRSC